MSEDFYKIKIKGSGTVIIDKAGLDYSQPPAWDAAPEEIISLSVAIPSCDHVLLHNLIQEITSNYRIAYSNNQRAKAPQLHSLIVLDRYYNHLRNQERFGSELVAVLTFNLKKLGEIEIVSREDVATDQIILRRNRKTIDKIIDRDNALYGTTAPVLEVEFEGIFEGYRYNIPHDAPVRPGNIHVHNDVGNGTYEVSYDDIPNNTLLITIDPETTRLVRI